MTSGDRLVGYFSVFMIRLNLTYKDGPRTEIKIKIFLMVVDPDIQMKHKEITRTFIVVSN